MECLCPIVSRKSEFFNRQASELWQKQKSTKAMIVDALEQVRKKRANAPQ